MKNLFLLVTLFVLFAGNAFAFGTGEMGCVGDCTSCHKVTKQEAQDVVKKIDPLLIVESIASAPVPGLYQMVLSKGKDKGISYLDFSKRYMIQGAVIDTGNKTNITSKSMLELLESEVVDVSKIKLDNSLLMGNPKGTKRLYLFTDPDCPYCPKAHEAVQQLVQSTPELAVYILLFPLDMHPDAAWKTNAIVAASKKDMKVALKMLEDSYGKKTVKKNPKAKDYATTLKSMAKELGLVSTPSIVYENGKIGLGVKTLKEMSEGLAKYAKQPN